VLRKERERKRLAAETVATELGYPLMLTQRLKPDHRQSRNGAANWPQIAIKLFAPTSRLISETGKSIHAKPGEGQCGKLIKAHREKRELKQEDLAVQLEMPVEELDSIEAGTTPLEVYAPMLLRFSELIEQPIFNLFYPCGLPLDKLQDYP